MAAPTVYNAGQSMITSFRHRKLSKGPNSFSVPNKIVCSNANFGNKKSEFSESASEKIRAVAEKSLPISSQPPQNDPPSLPLSRLETVRQMYPEALDEAKVWLSDVIGRKQRPYFLNRKFTAKDISYAVYMIVVHGMCLAAPATFSWDAFGCFALLYIITGDYFLLSYSFPFSFC